MVCLQCYQKSLDLNEKDSNGENEKENEKENDKEMEIEIEVNTP